MTAVPSAEPTAWCTLDDVYATGSNPATEEDTDLLSANILAASNIMWRLTGMQYPGERTTVLRPCCLDEVPTGGAYVPVLVAGQWFNLGGPYGECACLPYRCGRVMPTIDLGCFPVTTATIKIDGAAVASGWRIDSWRLLVRTDGNVWPPQQNLLLADTEVGTWSVTATHGQPPPTDCVMAAAQLAGELTKHCKRDPSCSLPLQVTAINRQGVTYSIANVMDVIEKGRTGLYFVDLVIQGHNPDGLRRPPRVLSPDRPAHVRRG